MKTMRLKRIRKVMNKRMDDRNTIKMLAAVLLAIVTISLLPVGKADAASVAGSSLGRLKENEAAESVQKDAKELLSDADLDEEYQKAFDKKKWKKQYTKADLRELSCIIFAEANAKGFGAMAAVGNVVVNRMNNDDDWGHVNTIHDVIYDRKWGVQFAPIVDGNLKKAYRIYDNLNNGTCKEWEVRDMNRAIEAATAVLKGYNAVPEDFVYFNGYVDKTLQKCLEKGYGFWIKDRHIYFVEKVYAR